MCSEMLCAIHAAGKSLAAALTQCAQHSTDVRQGACKYMCFSVELAMREACCVSSQAASESSTDFSGQCVSVLIGSGLSSNTILGAPFLRAFYSVYTYDMASKVAQIGFAQAANGNK